MPVEEPHRVVCHLDRMLDERGLTLAALAEQHDVVACDQRAFKLRDDRVVQAVQAWPRIFTAAKFG